MHWTLTRLALYGVLSIAKVTVLAPSRFSIVPWASRVIKSSKWTTSGWVIYGSYYVAYLRALDEVEPRRDD